MVEGFFGGLIFIGIALFYFLPTIIAGKREVAATGSILLVNILLGWTVLGWVACLIWANSAETKAVRAYRERQATGRP